MLKVGKITEEENKEISDIHEKLIALNNLLLLENLSSEINSNLSEDIRKAIQEDRLLDFKEEFLNSYGRDVYERAF